MPLPSPPATEPRHVEPRIWKACAGSSVKIPVVNSRVYYFPQGHMEQSTSPVHFRHISPLVRSKPLVHCQVSSVLFLADPVTDEVFVKLRLIPTTVVNHRGSMEDVKEEEAEEDKIVSFAKVLTPSDANNGGGFSVPRFCADSIFPPLNFQAEPPVQTLSITDVHGVVWNFRHIYRGTPRRHLLTTGWSKYVNHKKLVAGDSVVFMRNMRGDMFSGVRRALRSTYCGDDGRWGSLINAASQVKAELDYGAKDGFSRSGRGRVSLEAVLGAAELAAHDMPFEVVYYPKAGWSDFVVRAEVVEEALKVYWTPGMRVKMAVETEDSSRMTWFQGTVSAAVLDSGLWQGSPWRMLQVTWDEPEVLYNAKNVSPWQVEYITSAPPLHTAFSPAKNIIIPQNSRLLNDGLSNSPMSPLNMSLLGYNTLPAGMQGARQNSFSVSSFSNLLNQNSPRMRIDNFSPNNMVPKLDTVCTDLNIGSSPSESLSPDSQSSIRSFGTELDGKRGSSFTKAGISSFQLFGQVIYYEQPLGGYSDVSTEDDGSKMYNDIGGLNNQMHLS